MFKKLFDKIDDFIEKFNEISNLEQFAIEVLHLIENAFFDNISNNRELNEKMFDEIMQKPGLWKSIGQRLKKALKDKEAFLKQLLYIFMIMSEFERRYRTRQKSNRKDKETNKIIEKYTKEIKEISENPDFSQEYKNDEIKKIRATMEKEIKALDLELTR